MKKEKSKKINIQNFSSIFKGLTLSVLPFNINAHYLDSNPHSTHVGETRATRIKEFHVFHTTPVGLSSFVGTNFSEQNHLKNYDKKSLQHRI